jgi:predicted metal-dependent enzyme (double-stranded beta helix superfamily)
MSNNYNWLVTDDGQCTSFGTVDNEPPERTYRLYRFLTELDDILERETDDAQRVCAIIPLVRKLLISSYWLQMDHDPPSEKTGWSVKFLYREHEYPITVQMVVWAPGSESKIHNHATWGIVAIIGGVEKNTFWKQSPENPQEIFPAGEKMLYPGDIIGFTGNAVHQVAPIGGEPTISFNLYGITQRGSRYKYEAETLAAENF